MRIYTRSMCAVSAVNLIVCSIITVCGYVNYDWIYGGEWLNIVGMNVVLFSLWITLGLILVYKILTRSYNTENTGFPHWAVTVYIPLILNCIYSFFFMRSPTIEGNTDFTGTKLMFYLAIALISNFSFFIETLYFVDE